MDIFLKFVGALFCALILLLVVLVVFIRFAVKRMAKSLTESLADALPSDGAVRTNPVAPRIHLQAEPGPCWEDQASASRCVQALRDLGFEPAGYYAVPEIPDLHLEAWSKPAESVYSIIYEKPNPGLWMDYVSVYQDGTSVTVTNSAAGHQLEHRPGHDKIYDADLDATALYRRMMDERPQRPLVTITADNFVERFERAYADEIDWRNSRGGATEDEIRRIAAGRGQTLTDEQVAAMRESKLIQACADLEVGLRERFRQQRPMPDADWDALSRRLVFVHDRLTPVMVAARFAENRHFDGDEYDDHTVSHEHGLPARDAFRTMNMELEPRLRYEKIGELSEPLPVDVYRTPHA